MQYVLKNNGPTTEFAGWLKNFKEVQNSLLIELADNEKAFISKLSSLDKDLVKYSKIYFTKCNLEFVSATDDAGNPVQLMDKRIKIGVISILSKLIEVISMYSEVEHEIVINFAEFSNPNGGVEYHAQEVLFKSKQITMRVPCANISEFVEITDDIFFNVIYTAQQPIVAKAVSQETIKSLISASAVFSADAKRDIMKFYTKADASGRKALYVYDETNKAYDFLLTYLDDEYQSYPDVALSIYRSNFIRSIKGSNGSMDFSLGTINGSRILIDFEDGQTKAIVAVIVS